jgi:hypothetical protein
VVGRDSKGVLVIVRGGIGGGGQMEAEETTNESRGLVGGGGGQMEAERDQSVIPVYESYPKVTVKF